MSRLQYSSDIRLLRVMCTGRIDLGFVVRSFAKGADAVFIAGCHLNECNYITHGNFYALRMTHIGRRLLELVGLAPERLRMECISGGEGTRFAELVDEFSEVARSLGPLGSEDGLTPEALASRLQAAGRLVPHLKLLERERFRVPFETRAECDAFFSGEEFRRLFRETVGEKFASAQIAQLLEARPQGVREIAAALDLPPAEVSRHLNRSSRQGLVRYDPAQQCYALA